jgi:DNA adenine methylase
MSYPGGKGASGVVQAIINQQPPHDTYIEAFLGGGSVMKAKRPAAVNVGIDLDPRPIANFGVSGSAQLLCCDAKRYLRERRDWTGRELVYCDPPYLFSTRKNFAKMYRFEMDDNAHASLLQTISLLPCMVQISGYPSTMYDVHLRGWRKVTFRASTRHGMQTECLWMNYPRPIALHDYRFLGFDYRERERIRRKAHRWMDRLASLPIMERLAIYSRFAGDIAIFEGATAAIRRDLPGHIAGNDDIGRRPSLDPAMTDRTQPETTVLDQ